MTYDVIYLCISFEVDANYKSMEDLANAAEAVVATIKERLLTRFGRAKEQVGPNWRNVLAESDDFFNTKTGVDYMRSVAQAYSNAGRGHVDRIERVAIALEKIAGIHNPPIA